ncbi:MULTISPECIES: sigma-70 family RNA polymerase sigma factor [unclassified Synechococcus]|uniref:sigma-70 family RNA polymerase sigma factor n=1 Tax=unclassified Synechococcus TaxID=2626047 RepID=UPI000AE55B0C|nr:MULTISPECIES: sigma-70 family RNA polymerase sigma factor [unclassified Synechococcus]TWB90692.1 RNA polymerase sigma-70 factor (ECF subfamily) [Synechococcus sp. Ace-Pa]
MAPAAPVPVLPVAMTRREETTGLTPMELAQQFHGDLASLYDATSPAVYRLALKLCRSPQEAEDLTHDVYLRYWRQGRYDPARGPVVAYLLLLTRSMALNRLSQRQSRWQKVQQWSSQLLPRTSRGPQECAETDNLAERVRAALDTIPPRQRQVLELAYYEGLSQSAIASQLQLPLGTVKTHARQGLIRLRTLLNDFAAQP